MASVAFGVWLSILFRREGSTFNREMTASIHTPVNLGLNVARTKLKKVVPVLLAFAMGACQCFFVVLCLSHQTYVMFLNVFLRTFPFLAHDPCLLEPRQSFVPHNVVHGLFVLDFSPSWRNAFFIKNSRFFTLKSCLSQLGLLRFLLTVLEPSRSYCIYVTFFSSVSMHF